jgi:hypothetical protein
MFWMEKKTENGEVRGVLLACLWGLSLALLQLFSSVSWAGGDCGIEGYLKLPCHASYQPTRKNIGNGITELLYVVPQKAAVLYRAVPAANYAQHPNAMKALLDDFRGLLIKQWGEQPVESWGFTKGIDYVQFRFTKNRIALAGRVRDGYLLAFLQFSDVEEPLIAFLAANEQFYPAAERVKTALIPLRTNSQPIPMQPSSPSQPPPVQQPSVQAVKGSWTCSAVGTYRVCQETGGSWGKTCYPRTATGMAIGATEMAARVLAESNCGSHMTKMIIIANMGGGGHSVVPCRATACRQIK